MENDNPEPKRDHGDARCILTWPALTAYLDGMLDVSSPIPGQ